MRSAHNNAASSTDAQQDDSNRNADNSQIEERATIVEHDETPVETQETPVESTEDPARSEDTLDPAVIKTSDDSKAILRLEVDLEEARVENETLLDRLRNERKLNAKLGEDKFELVKSGDFISKQFDEEKGRTQALQRQLEQALEQLRLQKAENSHLCSALESLTNRFDEEQGEHQADNEKHVKALEQLKDDHKRVREDSDSKDMTIKLQAEQIHDLEEALRDTQELLEAAQADILNLRPDIDEIDLSPTMRSPTRIILRKPPRSSLDQESPSSPPEEMQTPLFNNLMKSIWRPGKWSIRGRQSSNAGSGQGSTNAGPVFRAADESSSSHMSQSSSYSSSSTHSSAIPSPLRPRSSIRSSFQETVDVGHRHSPTFSDVSPLSSPHSNRPKFDVSASEPEDCNITDRSALGTPMVSPPVVSSLRSSSNSPAVGSATLGSTTRSALASMLGERYTVQMSLATQTITPQSARSPATPPTYPPPQTGPISHPGIPSDEVGLGITGVPDDARDACIEQSPSISHSHARNVQPDQTPEELQGPAGAMNVFVQHDVELPAAPGDWKSKKVDAATQADLSRGRSDLRYQKIALANAGWLFALICVLVALLCASGALSAYFAAHVLGFAGRAHAWSSHGAFGVSGYPYDHWTTRMKTDFTLMASRYLGTSLLNHT